MLCIFLCTAKVFQERCGGNQHVDNCVDNYTGLHVQVLHVLGHCLCDAPSGRVHLPLHSRGLQEHCGGQRHGHAHASVLHPAGWLCHCQALHPPMGRLVSTLAVTYSSEQTVLERQDLPCTYLAHHELESVNIIIISIIDCEFCVGTTLTTSQKG